MDIDQRQVVPHTFEKPEPNSQTGNSETTRTTTSAPPPREVVVENAKKKNRCFQCNKKLGLIPFNCKCGAITCINCKWPGHACTYDYRAEAAERLAKENPAIVADKLTRI